jgi:hypothetical protein
LVTKARYASSFLVIVDTENNLGELRICREYILVIVDTGSNLGELRICREYIWIIRRCSLALPIFVRESPAA